MSDPIDIRERTGPRRDPGSDKPAPRKPRGIAASWAPLRKQALRRVLRMARNAAVDISSPLGALAHAVAAWARHHGAMPDERVVGAALEMMDGRVADLSRSEDRAQSLALAATAIAMRGETVHIACLSDERAAHVFQPVSLLSEHLAITASKIADDADFDARRDGHQAAIVVASAMRLSQDLLRDRMHCGARATGKRRRVGRLARQADSERLIAGNPALLVDDADLQLIDPFRTTGFGGDPEQEANGLRAEEAFVIIANLRAGQHYLVDDVTRRIRFTDLGIATLELAATLFGGPWARRKWREETVLAALTVRDFFKSGQDYTVDGGRVELTAPPSSSIEPGIDALVAAKERLSQEHQSTRLWSLQNYFAVHTHLAGVGFAASANKNLFAEFHGFDVAKSGEPLPTPSHTLEFSSRKEQIRLLRDLPQEAQIWFATPRDAEAVARAAKIPASRCVVGDAIFATRLDAPVLVQIGSAPPQWEQRVAAEYPDLPVTVLASSEDGLFDIYRDKPPGSVARYRDDPCAETRRAALASWHSYFAERRVTLLRSERYFDRILAFTGGGP